MIGPMLRIIVMMKIMIEIIDDDDNASVQW
jgi:hypothetical protein